MNNCVCVHVLRLKRGERKKHILSTLFQVIVHRHIISNECQKHDYFFILLVISSLDAAFLRLEILLLNDVEAGESAFGVFEFDCVTTIGAVFVEFQTAIYRSLSCLGD